VEFHPIPPRSSLIEEDIEVKLATYLAVSDPAQRISLLADFIEWFDNPLLLWDMMQEVVHSVLFFSFITRIHQVCQLYLEGKQYEHEVYDTLATLCYEHTMLSQVLEPAPGGLFTQGQGQGQGLPSVPLVLVGREPSAQMTPDFYQSGTELVPIIGSGETAEFPIPKGTIREE
jgi:hypothetical protein